MRDGDPFADGGGAEALAGHQGVEQIPGVQLGILSAQDLARHLQRALLAGGVEVVTAAFGAEDAVEIHRHACSG
ncbi:MAG: hypothetical protein U5R48_15920 [Gammaproteobacteria bacterium]|nr:hypothetical protein [Gammaproteobacteria bacterium]